MTPTPSRTIIPAAPDWRDQAACAIADADLFYPEGRIAVDAKASMENEAKQVCQGCPVRSECLTYALDTREPHGVWGGLTEDERKSVLRKRNRDKKKAEADAAPPVKPPVKPLPHHGPMLEWVLGRYSQVEQFKAAGWGRKRIGVELRTSMDTIRRADDLVAETGSAEAALDRLAMERLVVAA